VRERPRPGTTKSAEIAIRLRTQSGGHSVTYGPEALRAAREAGVDMTAASSRWQ
jgi:hypothetical protein